MRQDPKLTRGYRNRNPGNIDHVPSNKWLGLADPPLEPPPRAGGRARFCVFKTHQHGIRALRSGSAHQRAFAGIAVAAAAEDAPQLAPPRLRQGAQRGQG